MASSIISGITNLTIDGNLYAVSEDSVKFELARVNREPVMSINGDVYWKETPVPAKLSFAILIDTTVDPTTFNSKTASNIVVQAAGGVVLNANNFKSSGSNAYNLSDGKLELEFFGKQIKFSVV